MPKKKKMTLAEKMALTKKGICWKCDGKLINNDGIKKCSECDFKVPVRT